MADVCEHCGSTKELVSNVIIKRDMFYDMREVSIICDNCFWPKSRIRTYVDDALQEKAEKPFRKYGKQCAELTTEKIDNVILASVGAK